MVGSAAATALAKLACMQNKKVILLEAAPEKKIVLGTEYSNRVSALSPSSVGLLANLGAWSIMSDARVSPVRKMRVWDGCSNAGIVFGDDDNQEPLSYLVENDITVKALTGVMNNCDNLEVKYGARVKNYHLPVKEDNENRAKEQVVVELEDGETIKTSLLVGADGFKSLVRRCLGCDYVGWEYEQVGVVATIHTEPVQGGDNVTAWQRFLPTGPVALLPLDKHHSSLVWTVSKDMAKEMVQMEEKVFIDKLNRALLGRENENSVVNSISEGFESLLNIVLPSQRSYESPPLVKGVMNRAAFPLGFGHSSRYIGSRTVLVGDAAHRIHPLAGQGVNLGFGDVAYLAEVVEGMVVEGGGLGHHEYLCQYETERQRHNLATMVGVDALQKLYCTDNIPLVLARSLGILATNAAGPVKNLIRQHAG